MRRLTIILLITSSALWGQASPNAAPGYQQTYDRLLQQIRQIAIFDDHGHPGFADDSDVDAMASPPLHSPLRLRLDNPELVAPSNTESEPVKQLMVESRKQGEIALKRRIQQAEKDGEISADINPSDYARFFSLIVAGLAVQSVNGATRAEMQRSADILLGLLNYQN